MQNFVSYEINRQNLAPVPPPEASSEINCFTRNNRSESGGWS